MVVEKIKNVVIIGAGLMGHNVAQIALMSGYNVKLVDIKQEFLDNGRALTSRIQLIFLASKLEMKVSMLIPSYPAVNNSRPILLNLKRVDNV